MGLRPLVSFASLVAVASLVASCGGGQETPAESNLTGDWASTASGQCVDVYTFGPESALSRGIACVLADGLALEVQEGSYSVVGSQIQYTLTRATCPGDEIPVRSGAIGFTLSKESLILMFSNAQETLKPGRLNGTLVYGCFHGDVSKFTASPIAPLL